MSGVEWGMILAGAFGAGLVTGLAGFGVALVSMGFWLHVLPPATAAPLAVACSVIAQATTFPRVWHALDMRRSLPFILPGVLGVPVGSALFALIDPPTFKAAVGALLIVYCSTMLFVLPNLPPLTWGGRPADGAVGLAGGVLGGLAGLSGVLPTIWCSLRRWSKDAQRSVYQPYNMTILSLALIGYGVQGALTPAVGWLTLACLAPLFAGAWLGVTLYGSIDERQFRALVLGLLLGAGAGLVVSNLL